MTRALVSERETQLRLRLLLPTRCEERASRSLDKAAPIRPQTERTGGVLPAAELALTFVRDSVVSAPRGRAVAVRPERA